MKVEMYQKLRLKNGRVERVIEVFNNGEAYMLDIMTEDGEYELETIYPKDIKSVIVEVEKSFTIATAS